MELFDHSLWGAPLALIIAVVALVWRRWVLPLVMGLVALPLGAVVGRFTWDWFADRPPGIDFGSEFEGYGLGDRLRVGGGAGRRAAGCVAFGSKVVVRETAG